MKDKREIVNYLVFGLITTFINFVSYALLTQLLHADFKTATTIAAFLSVLFAFITNKLYVFQSRDKHFIVVTKS
jgi:putative flippase GtrA